MATKDISQTALNKTELKTLERILYATAPIIDAIMRDGVPYTKLLLEAGAPPAPPTGGQ